MPRHRFHLVNVFCDDSLFSGNALCVFEDAAPLTEGEMRGLARQFNLAETTFLFRSEHATARVRILTPSSEMPFAGHPTLGTAHVVRMLGLGGDAVTLEMKAGVIPVTASGDVWTLRANPPRARPLEASRAELAATLGLGERDLADGAMWLDTGSEQLIVPLASPDAVARCAPTVALETLGSPRSSSAGAYVWARVDDTHVTARFFYVEHGAVLEDPGTGSACANLGGWLVVTGAPAPSTLTVRQGDRTGRPCSLGLRLDPNAQILVTGLVRPLGSGEVFL